MKKDNESKNPKEDWRNACSAEEFKKLVQEYIKDADIDKYSGLPTVIKSRARSFGFNSSDFSFPKSIMSWEKYSDIPSIQKFIDENNIYRISDLPKGLREKIRRNLKIDISNFKFRDVFDKENYSKLEDIQKFVNENYICSEKNFEKRKKRVYSRAKELNLLDKIKYVPTTNKNKRVVPMNLEDLKKFVVDNNISSRSEFSSRFTTLYKKSKNLGLIDKLVFPKDKIVNHWEDYDKEKIQSYINDNDVDQFSSLPNGLKAKIHSIGLHSYDFEFKYSRERWEKIGSEEIQKYITENCIIQFSDLPEPYKCKIYSMGLNSRDFNFPKSFQWWDEYNDPSEFQKFIEDQNIQTPTEFMNNYNGLYKKYKRLGYSMDTLVFPRKRKPKLEIRLERFLNDNNIKFETQKKFEDLGKLRFDFWIPEFNIILEPGGDQHISPVDFFGGKEGFEETRKRDTMKYEYCKSNNITVLYYFEFTLKEDYQKLFSDGYLPGSEWYTDFDLFCQRILELTNKGKA